MREDVGVGACCGQCVYIYTTNLYSRAIKTTEELIHGFPVAHSRGERDRENMKVCFSCPWSLSLSLPSSDVRSRVQVWVRQKENHNLDPSSARAANVNDTLTSLSTSLCSWCILVCNPSSRLFIMTGSTRGDCHRLCDGNMKRSCLSVSGSGEVTVFSSDVQPSSTWKKNEGVRLVLVSLPFDIVLDDYDYDILVSQSYIWWLRPL